MLVSDLKVLYSFESAILILIYLYELLLKNNQNV